MSRFAVFVAVTGLAILLPSFTNAQYLYLDSNSDGERTGADLLAPSGPTHVDVWLLTDRNRDGSSATCISGETFTINSYEFILHAMGGTVAWSEMRSYFPERPIYFGTDSSEVDFYALSVGGEIFPPGKYHLASLTITPVQGDPTIRFASSTPLNAVDGTSFGSRCSGRDEDNTLKLGSDWLDADGLGSELYRPGPPILAATPDITMELATTEVVNVAANDWDDDTIVLRLIDAPSFAQLTTTMSAPGHVTGQLRLVATQTGRYAATIGASDGISEVSDTIQIVVEDNGIHHAPLLEPIEDVTVEQGTVANRTIIATDPDGDGMRIDLVRAPSYVRYASALGDPGRLAATFRVAPGGSDIGGTVVVRAADNYLEDVDSFEVFVQDRQFAPEWYPREWYPGSRSSCAEQEGTSWFGLGYSDPDRDSVTVTATGLPTWAAMSVIPLGNGSGGVELRMGPDTSDSVGTYVVRLRIEDTTGRVAETSLNIRLGPPGSCGGGIPFCSICVSAPIPPVAHAGGPYAGVAGNLIQFNGSRTTQGSGGVPGYRWEFGDGATATGPVVHHVYPTGGSFTAVLRVFNSGGQSRDSAVVSVREGFAVRAFSPAPARPVVVIASAPEFTIHLEAAESTYVVADIDPESVFLRSTQDSVWAGISSKARRITDSDRNGLPELELVVPGAGLRRLFSGVRGRTQMTVKVTGRLVTGAHLVGSLPLEIVGVPQVPIRSGVWPNPMNPSGIIAFHNERAGRVRVELYDVSGRLVRTVWDGVLPEGLAELPVDGKNDRGTALSSGVYYYRVETVDGMRKGRLTVLK